MRRLTAIDAQFLYTEEMAPAAHQHTLKVSVVGPGPTPYSFADTKELLRARLHLLPPFRWRLVRVPGDLHHPVWIEDPDFDLDFHVRRMGCPAPGGDRELCELIADILGRPLDRGRPLWELYLVEGLTGGRVAAVAKVHHALADGVASAELLDLFFDRSADAPEPAADPWRPDPVPRRPRLVVDAAVDVARLLARGLPTIVRLTRRARARKRIDGLLASQLPPKIFTAPPTPFNRPLTPHRTFAVLSVGLDEVKAVKAAFGTTINDVVLAVAAGGVRRYLSAHGSPPAGPLVGSIPVSTRAEHEKGTWGNRLAKIYVALPTDVADPVERLRAAKVAADAAKADLERTRGSRLENWIEFLPVAVLRGIFRLFAAQVRAGKSSENLVVSNVPGPRTPLFIGGAPLDTFFSVGPLTEGVGLNITAWSYVDRLNVSLLACREAVPDLWELTDCLHEAFEELQKSAAATA